MRSPLLVLLLLAVSGCDFASLFAPPADDAGTPPRRRTSDCEADDDCDGGEVCDDGDCVEIGEGEGEGELPGEGEGEGELPGEGEGEGEVSDDVIIELTWNTADGDVDLHLNRGAPPNWCVASTDCYFGGPSSTWGATLELDDLEGFGPERIRLTAPADGIYTVGVGVYRLGMSPLVATVTVTQRGEVLHTSTESLTNLQWQPVALEVTNGVVAVEVLNIVERVDGACWGPTQ